MPIYEYVCAKCKTRFEAMRSMSQANAPITCERCQSKKTSRVPSVFSASSGGKPISGAGGGCGSCAGGSCGSCGHK